MSRTLLASAFAASLLFGALPASAQAIQPLPLADAAQPAVTLVAGGCGPAFHRGPYGGCRPNVFGGYRRFGYGRPFGYGYHRFGYRRGFYR